LIWFFIAEIRRFATTFESRSATTMMWVYLLVAVALTINLIITMHSLVTNFEDHQILGPTLSNSLSIFVASVVGHMSYLGMTAERSIDKLATAREQYQKSKAWQEKAQELTLMDRQLSLGLISNSLTHAISQPLSSMLIHTRLAQRLLQKPDFDRELLAPHIELITTETKRTSETIENIRRFIRPVDNKPQNFALSALLGNIQQLLYQEALIHNIELKWAPDSANVHLFADLTQTTQACLIVLQKVFTTIPYKNGRATTINIRIVDEAEKIKLIFIYPGTEIDIKSLEIAQMIVSIAAGSIHRLSPENNQSVLCIELQKKSGSSTPHVHVA
jgi:C4-dicarboxylate-specific signal transduction histidine kinase